LGDYEMDLKGATTQFLPFAELEAPSPYHPPSKIARAPMMHGMLIYITIHYADGCTAIHRAFFQPPSVRCLIRIL
jgi:hypothetical protein